MQQYAASSMVGRMIRAARLENEVYEEVERDKDATTQALTVVVIVAIAAGIGSALSLLIAGVGIGSAILGLISGIVGAVVGWAIWSFLTYWIGTSLFGGKATYGELLRTIGFAFTPNALGIFSFIPFLGGLIAFVGSIWALVAAVIAVRQALDFDTGKAILTAIIGWIVLVIIYAVLGALGLGFMMLG